MRRSFEVGGGERQAETAVGRRDARQRGVERLAWKNMVTPAQRREAVTHLETTHEMSEWRSCRTTGVRRTSIPFRSTKPDDGQLRARIKALAHERRRFGFRRLHVLLRREGLLVNRKRVQPNKALLPPAGSYVRGRSPDNLGRSPSLAVKVLLAPTSPPTDVHSQEYLGPPAYPANKVLLTAAGRRAR